MMDQNRPHRDVVERVVIHDSNVVLVLEVASLNDGGRAVIVGEEGGYQLPGTYWLPPGSVLPADGMAVEEDKLLIRRGMSNPRFRPHS